MSYEVRKPSRIRVLAQQSSGQNTADYSTLAAAIAASADWDVLNVLPGTYTFGQETLPAGKTIQGTDRDTCILQTTLNVLNDSALAMGHESCLRNLYVRGAAAGVNGIHLLDFGGAAAGQYVVLDGIRVDNGGGAQPYVIHAPIRANECWVALNPHIHRAIGVNGVASALTNCRIQGLIAGIGLFVFAYANYTITGCTMEGSGVNWIAGNTAITMSIVGCTWVSPAASYVVLANDPCTLTFAGNDFGQGRISITSAASTVYFQGNTGYPTGAISSLGTAGAWKQADMGNSASITATPYSLAGWESLASVDNAAVTTVNLPACANFGCMQLLISDAGGHADLYPITVARSSTDTFADGSTSYVINEKWGWVLLAKNEASAPDTWRIIKSSRFQAPELRGLLCSNGFAQRGWAEPSGGVVMQGRGLLDLVTTSPVGVWGVNASGAYLQQASTGVAGDRMYWYTGAVLGPVTGSIPRTYPVFRIELTAASNDQRFVCGFWDAAQAPNLALDSDDPDGPYMLVQKISGAATARIAARNNTVAMGGTQTVGNFTIGAVWTPLANTVYYIVLAKASTAFVYDAAGALLSAANITKSLDVATSLRVVCGIRDLTGAVGRDIKQYGCHFQQYMNALGV